MIIKTIAYAYWRSIKRTNRLFINIPDNLKEDVKALAKQEVENNIITIDLYIKLIGENYN